MNYSQKLKDPRWQKKRLEILERDGWRCQQCGSVDQTLHIHHIAYTKCEPWNIPNRLLITLCEYCHDFETTEIKEAVKRLVFEIKFCGFTSDMVHHITDAFADLSLNMAAQGGSVEPDDASCIADLIRDHKEAYCLYITSEGNR